MYLIEVSSKCKIKNIKYYKNSTDHNFEGLIKNLKLFIDIIKNKKYFDKTEFNNDIKSTELILKMR